MTTKTDAISLTLKPGEEDRLLRGHRWVFSNELQEVPKTAEPGTLAVLHTSRGKALGMGFFNPGSLIAFRLLARAAVSVDAGFFRDRFQACLDMRRRHLGEVESFRLAFGESDGLPGLIVDKYGDVLVVQVLAAGMQRRLEDIQTALVDTVCAKGVYLKNDHPVRALEGLDSERRTLWGEVPEKVLIEEAGLKYHVAPAGQHKTGFYFDHRDNRTALVPYVKDRVVLDLYCYTGAFSLRAARGGAARAFGLDSSENAVELAKENAGLNGLQDACQFECGDAEQVLADFSDTRRRLRPDIVVLDPPSLVTAKKHLPKALRAYARLNANAFRCLPHGGLVATSACSHHVSRESFLKMLREAAGKAQKTVRVMEVRGQAKDHPFLLSMPETEYLHFALLEVL
ncbi:MAG: class I SAM-dependent rRNA methyltransferase [Elusimicrobiota bacterium]